MVTESRMEIQREYVLCFLLGIVLSERVLRRFLQIVPFAWGKRTDGGCLGRWPPVLRGGMVGDEASLGYEASFL
jgi:hypothetical protein